MVIRLSWVSRTHPVPGGVLCGGGLTSSVATSVPSASNICIPQRGSGGGEQGLALIFIPAGGGTPPPWTPPPPLKQVPGGGGGHA